MKKLIKFLVWAAGIVVVLLILTIVGLKLFFPVEKIRTMAVEEGSARLGRPLAVEALDLSFWGGLGVNLQNVTLGNPPDFEAGNVLQAEGVDVKLQIIPLIYGEYRIKRLIINQPEIDLRTLADGSNNFTFEFVDSALIDSAQMTPEQVEALTPESKAAAVAVSFDRLEINQGRLTYRDDSTGMVVALGGFDLSTGLENPRAGIFQSVGKMNITELAVTTEEPMPVIKLGLDYDVTYDMEADRLTIGRADTEVNDLAMELSGEVTGLAGQMKGRVNVKSDGVSITDLLGMLTEKQREGLADFDIEGNFSLNADLDYDAAGGDDALDYTGNAVITDLKMSKADIEGELALGKALLDFKTDNLRMTIEDGSFNNKPLSGYLAVDDFENPFINGELDGSFNLAYVQPFLPAGEGTEAVTHQLDGEATFSARFSGKADDPTGMNFSGSLAVEEGRYSSSLTPEAIESVVMDMQFDNRVVTIRRLEGTVGAGSFAVTARINDLVPYLLADSNAVNTVSPEFESTLKGGMNLAMLNPYLPEKGNPELTGRFDMDMTLAGKLDRPETIRPRGSLKISDASYTDSLLAEPIESFALDITMVPDTVQIKSFSASFTSSDFALTGKMARPFPYLLPLESIDRSKLQKPMLTFRMSSRRFDVDKLFPEVVPGSGEKLPEGEAALDSISIVMIPDIEGTGTLNADTVIYTRVEFTNITGDVTIKDRKLTCRNVVGDVYTGKVKGETTIDLNDFDNPRYVGNFRAEQIEVNDFVSRFTKFGGHLYGKGNMEGNFDAVGWEPEQLLNSLTLDGLGDMVEGKLVTSGALYSVLKGLGDKLGETVNQEQALKNLATKISVKDGKVYLDDMKTKLGNLGDITFSGYYGFNDQIDYSGTLLLSESMTQKLSGALGGLASLLGGGTGQRMTLPLKITGTIDNPKPELDMNAMSKKATENLQEDATNLLKGLFKKK